MALLVYNNQTLTWNGEVIHFETTGVPVTVGFYQITGTTLSSQPSLFLCQEAQYAVRVGIPDVEIEPPGLFISASGEGYALLPPGEQNGLLSSDGLLAFEILQKGPILTNRPFRGRLGFTEGLFSLDTTSEPELVDYPHNLPTLINSCQFCGCPEGSECGNAGVCKPIPPPCPDNAPCGYGRFCSGPCPPGFDCQSMNGIYRCVSNNTNNVAFWIVLLLIIFLLIFAFVIIFMMTSNKPMTKPSITLGS